jgi:RNA polymerase sigma-70 factor, ECF subfamily
VAVSDGGAPDRVLTTTPAAPPTDQGAARQPPRVDGSAAPALAPPQGPRPAPLALPSFHEVYAAHFRAVWLTLRRLGVWERELEDAAHDVFLVVHRRLADFDASRPIRPWLLGIAAKVASEFRRRARNRREVVSEDIDQEGGRIPTTTPAHGQRADRVLDDNERRSLLHRALATLDPDQRAVVVLHDIEGHPMPELAWALQANINTLYSRLRQGRTALKAAVTALGADDAQAVGPPAPTGDLHD